MAGQENPKQKRLKNNRLIGLIGYPLTHSFSQRYFTSKFRNEGIEGYQYLNFELKSIDSLSRVLSDNPGLIGLNVTIPYKQSVIPFLNSLSREAQQIGAVNTIIIDNSSYEPVLQGHNTDHIGFNKTLEMITESNPRGAMILGTGGASKAVEFTLRSRSIPFQYVSRHSSDNIISYREINQDMISKFPLIINTTPLGMYPDVDRKPDIPYEFIGPNNILIDLVYNPEKTVFLQLGESAGAKTINGMPMLVEQAEAAWAIWQSKA